MTLNQSALAQLRRDVGEEVFPLILVQFREELIRQQRVLEQAVKQGDHAAVAECAHSLKSTARTIGLDSLADAAATAEQSAREDQASSLCNAQELLHLCTQAHGLLQALR